jgi:uncharacterized protein (DUF1697 family)
MLLTDRDFRSAIANKPFPEATTEPKTLHFFFLDAKLKSPYLNGLAKLAIPSERFQVVDNVFYLSAPDGFGRSRLAAGVERILDVATTVRNYSTIETLVSMLDADQ